MKRALPLLLVAAYFIYVQVRGPSGVYVLTATNLPGKTITWRCFCSDLHYWTLTGAGTPAFGTSLIGWLATARNNSMTRP